MFCSDVAVSHPDGDGGGRFDDPLHARGDVAGRQGGRLAEPDGLPDLTADLVEGDALFLENPRGDPVPLRQKAEQQVFAPHGSMPHFRGGGKRAVQRILCFLGKTDGHVLSFLLAEKRNPIRGIAQRNGKSRKILFSRLSAGSAV